MSSGGYKRQAAAAVDNNSTLETRFIEALSAMANQPAERFTILRTTPHSDQSVTFDYMVLDADLIPDPNITEPSAEIATRILAAQEQHWTELGLRAMALSVVSEHGPVPSKYSKTERIVMMTVLIGATVIGVLIALAGLAAYVVLRWRRKATISQVALGPSSSVSVNGPLAATDASPSISRQHSDVALLQRESSSMGLMMGMPPSNAPSTASVTTLTDGNTGTHSSDSVASSV